MRYGAISSAVTTPPREDIRRPSCTGGHTSWLATGGPSAPVSMAAATLKPEPQTLHRQTTLPLLREVQPFPALGNRFSRALPPPHPSLALLLQNFRSLVPSASGSTLTLSMLCLAHGDPMEAHLFRPSTNLPPPSTMGPWLLPTASLRSFRIRVPVKTPPASVYSSLQSHGRLHAAKILLPSLISAQTPNPSPAVLT